MIGLVARVIVPGLPAVFNLPSKLCGLLFCAHQTPCVRLGSEPSAAPAVRVTSVPDTFDGVRIAVPRWVDSHRGIG